MSEPYTVPLITKLLRAMPADQLASVHPHHFQLCPTRKIVKAEIIREIIANERDRRR